MTAPFETTPSGEHTPSEEKAARNSLGELLSDVSRDISILMRQEVELAKVELADSAKKAGAGAGLVSGAAYAASMTLLFLSIALWWALGDALDSLGWSAVIVAALWGVIGGALFAVGRARLREVKGAPQTIESLKKIPDAVKRNEENR
ncbi:phage holin family protein [Microcella sp.]|uniref:phage holin family protein n=1 Tax=Microcella sp. TaxID=1913979 RepID=UPI00391BE3BA